MAECYVQNIVRKGDVILTSPIEHHSNMVPWQIVAKKTNATLNTIPLDKNAQSSDAHLQYTKK